MLALKLPRLVENDPRHKAIEALLACDLRPLWEKGRILVPHIESTSAFKKSLQFARAASQMERGLENIDKILDAEHKGLLALQEKQGTRPANRVSRLLIVPNDCPERFYRLCDRTLSKNSDRVLGLHVNVTHDRLGENLFKAGALVKAMLVSEREAVSNVLFALVAESNS